MKPINSLLSLALCGALGSAYAAKPALQFKDVFDFSYPKHTVLAENGSLLAFSAAPYLGDAEGQVYTLGNNKLLASVERGTAPVINKNARWVAFMQKPALLEQETADKSEKKKLKNNLVLVDSASGEKKVFEKVKDFAISDDGRWLAYRLDEKNAARDKDENDSEDAEEAAVSITPDKKDKSYPLVIVGLESTQQTQVDAVYSYDFSHTSAQLVLSQSFADGADNQVALVELNDNFALSPLLDEPGIIAADIEWSPASDRIAFSAGNYVNDDARRRHYQIYLWNGANNQLKTLPPATTGWVSGKTTDLSWSEKGERLYFGTHPELAAKHEEKKYTDKASLTDYDTIREKTGLNVWHHKDAEIKPRQENRWKKEKTRHYQAVYHINGEKVVQLADEQMPDLELNTEAMFVLGSSDIPYLEKITYAGFYQDYYAVDVATGERQEIIKDFGFEPSLSPTGQYAAYFKDAQVWLKNLQSGESKNLTAKLDAVFADDKHDYPSEQPGYGFAGWMLDGSQVLAYSKYDIWAFDVKTGEGKRLTDGRKSETSYRVITLDDKQLGFGAEKPLLLETRGLKNKKTGVAKLSLTNGKVTPLLWGKARFDVFKKAKEADKYIFTKQDYHTFPDFWQTDGSFNKRRRITDLNPQVKNFQWGGKPELVSYKGYNGEDMQGVLIKPAGYKKGQKVPVVIYFYRYMSQRMYDFPKMELNHRPNFPMFTSNGYAVFLPDIRFEIGHPGKSSTQTMINAAQALIDMGVADPDAIGLQGHSWAGYQSAYMVTQTDMFKAVVSGAPVSNMTSAYSGIRLGSGLARQFQYETGQSRIGKTLYEAPELYIENSPVFFADKVNTPIMIMFGNNDGAVPWQEGIQYYLALRRAGKDVIFLEYEDEPHHLKKLPNQLDYSIRMMEYFDHHLKGKPAPSWMTKGVPFGWKE